MPLLPSILDVVSYCRSPVFGHVVRQQKDVPAHKALHCYMDLALGRPPNNQWKCCPGRPWERWIDQVHKGGGVPPASGGVRSIKVTMERCYGPHYNCQYSGLKIWRKKTGLTHKKMKQCCWLGDKKSIQPVKACGPVIPKISCPTSSNSEKKLKIVVVVVAVATAAAAV